MSATRSFRRRGYLHDHQHLLRLWVGPGGTSVYLANPSGHLITIDASTAKVTSKIAVAGAPNAVAVSPDGATVYVTGAKATKLFVIAAATGKIQATVPIGTGAAGVAVS